jgi:hypothetical protein
MLFSYTEVFLVLTTKKFVGRNIHSCPDVDATLPAAATARSGETSRAAPGAIGFTPFNNTWSLDS